MGLGSITNAFSTLGGFFESDAVKGATEQAEAKIERAKVDQIQEQTEDTLESIERDTAMNGLKKAAEFQVSF
ncbi:hypothetical protein TDB9533_00047 [Thalassocella blandensis]|nr:hypothetical protein TDB9533_00047 [Thalassocella blandensis]